MESNVSPASPVLLVDFENVQAFSPSQLPDDFHVVVFVGHTQKAIAFELVQKLQKLGARLQWCKVEGTGSNALDFYIAFYLGCRLSKSPKTPFWILSKDTGYDPLLCHLQKLGHSCKRIAALSELSPAPTSPKPLPKPAPIPKPILTPKQVVPEPFPNVYNRLIVLLSGTTRPATRATLVKHSASYFKDLPADKVEALVNRLFTEGKVSETGTKLTYHL